MQYSGAPVIFTGFFEVVGTVVHTVMLTMKATISQSKTATSGLVEYLCACTMLLSWAQCGIRQPDTACSGLWAAPCT